jgi:hypothetical protein
MSLGIYSQRILEGGEDEQQAYMTAFYHVARQNIFI